jgi:hypothetical protein
MPFMEMVLEKAVYIRYVTFRKVCYLGIVLEK